MKRKRILIPTLLFLAMTLVTMQAVYSVAADKEKTPLGALAILLRAPATSLGHLFAPSSFSWKTASDHMISITLNPNPGVRLVRIYNGVNDGLAESGSLLYERNTGSDGKLRVELPLQPHWSVLTVVAEDFTSNPPSSQYKLDGSTAINVEVKM